MLNVQVTAYGRQTVPDWGVVRSRDPLENFGAKIISLERQVGSSTKTANPRITQTTPYSIAQVSVAKDLNEIPIGHP